MDEKKQIEEMERVYDEARLKARETLGSMNYGEGMWYSKAFYKAGYRKQIEAEWLPHRFDKQGKPIRWYCSNCKGIGDGGAYCSHCGAIMKGGAE